LRFLFHFYDLQQKAGIQRAICELSNALVAEGHEVFIISGTARERVAYALDDRVSVIEIDHPEPRWSGVSAWPWKVVWALRQWYRVSRIARELKPSLFVDHGTSLGLLYPLRTLAGVPFVLARHFAVRSFPNGRVIHRVLSYVRSSSVIVVVTEGIASELRSYGHRKIYVIPYIVPADAQPSEYLHQSPRIGLLMGRAKPQKGFDIFLEALARERIPGWRFIIIGPGVEQDGLLKKLVGKYQLQDIVSLLPAVNEPFEYIRKASCVIMPSRYEALPFVALETLAIGRPLIASAVDGLKEVVVDGVNGRLFPPGDVRKLSECLVSSCRDVDGLAEYAKNAPCSLEKFRAKSVVEAWKALAMECSGRAVRLP
jgi:glycosyltransferase involved in cell wall biosynthesis